MVRTLVLDVLAWLGISISSCQGLSIRVGGGLSSAPYWPTKGGNLNHSGAAVFTGPSILSHPTWTFEEPSRETKGGSLMKVFHSSPVIDGSGNVYIQSTTGWVYSLSRKGEQRWAFKTSAESPGNLAVDAQSKSVYTISTDGTAFAIDAETGKERWRTKIADRAPDDTHSLSVVEDTLLTACSFNHSISALNNAVCAVDTLQGQLRWRYNMQRASGQVDALAANQVQTIVGDKVLFGDSFGGLYCVSLSEGKELWHTQHVTSLQRISSSHGMVPFGTTATAVVGSAGVVYHPFNLEGGKGTLRAHRLEDGQLLWQRNFDTEANVAPAVGMTVVGGRSASVVVLPLGSNPVPVPMSQGETALFSLGVLKPVKATVVAMDAVTGATVWTFTLPRWDGRVAGSFVSYDGSGDLCAPDNFGAPTIGADGTVYINWSGGYAFAVRDTNGDGTVDLHDPQEVSSYYHGYGTNGATALAPGFAVAPSCRRLLAFEM